MRKMMLSLLAGAIVVMSGCASMGGSDNRPQIDTMRIAQVEHAARLFGVQVYWVNYPTKSVTAVN